MKNKKPRKAASKPAGKSALDTASSIGITEGAGEKENVLSNPRHEAFAQAVSLGASDVDAYQRAFGCTKDAAESNASRMREIEGVSDRITQLQERLAAKCEMTREELVAILVKTLHAKPSDASLDNPLCDLKMSKAGPYPAFMEKAKAAERLCKMLGWDEPDKVEHSGEVNLNILTEERRRALAAKKREAILRRAAKPGVN